MIISLLPNITLLVVQERAELCPAGVFRGSEGLGKKGPNAGKSL